MTNQSTKLILIIGPNGVGKSTTAEAILQNSPRCARVDSDWCRSMNPFTFTEETKKTVTQNIFDMLKNYIKCTDIENVVFTYTFHGGRKDIFEEVMRRLKKEGCLFELKTVILFCTEEENRKRAKKDMRDNERIERGIRTTLHFYDDYEFPKIDTTNLTVEEAATAVMNLVGISK